MSLRRGRTRHRQNRLAYQQRRDAPRKGILGYRICIRRPPAAVLFAATKMGTAMRVTEEYLAQKKQAIAQVAMRMYCEVGNSVTMAAICEEAGIAKGTIFRYFPTREEMFREIYESCRAHAERMGNTPMPPGLTAGESIRSLIRQSFEWPVGYPLEFQFVSMYTDAMSFYIFDDENFARERFDALDSPRHSSLVKSVLRPDLPEKLAFRELSALINTASRYVIAHKNEIDDALMEAIVSSIYDAVFVAEDPNRA